MPITQDDIRLLFGNALAHIYTIEDTYKTQNKIALDQISYTKSVIDLIFNPPVGVTAALAAIAGLEWKEPWKGKKTTDCIPDDASYELVRILNQLCKNLLESKEGYLKYIAGMTDSPRLANKVTDKFQEFVNKQPIYEQLMADYEKEHAISSKPLVLVKSIAAIMAQEEHKVALAESEEPESKPAPSDSPVIMDADSKHEEPELPVVCHDAIEWLAAVIAGQKAEKEQIALARAEAIEEKGKAQDELALKIAPKQLKSLNKESSEDTAALKQMMEHLEKTRLQKEWQLKHVNQSSIFILLSHVKKLITASKDKEGSIDFESIKQLKNKELFGVLLQYPIENSNFKTFQEVLDAQSKGFFGSFVSKSLPAKDYAAALIALSHFLETQFEHYKNQRRTSLTDTQESIQTIVNISMLSQKMEDLTREENVLDASLEKNETQLSFLNQIAQSYEFIVSFNETIANMSYPELEQHIHQHLEDIKSHFIQTEPHFDESLDNAYYLAKLGSVLEVTKKSLIEIFVRGHVDFARELSTKEFALTECRQSTELASVMAEMTSLFLRVKQSLESEKTILSLISQDDLLHQEQLLKYVRYTKQLALTKVLDLINYRKRELTRFNNPMENTITNQFPRLKLVRDDLNGLFDELDRLILMSPSENMPVREDIEKDKRDLEAVYQQNCAVLQSSRKAFVKSSIDGLTTYILSNFDERNDETIRSLRTKLTNFANHLEPFEPAFEDIITSIHRALPNFETTYGRVLLNTIALSLLEYNTSAPGLVIDINPRLAEIKNSNRAYFTALCKLYTQIQSLENHAMKLSDKAEAKAPTRLCKGLRNDLNHFVSLSSPSESDWMRLRNCFNARLGCEEEAMSNHRALWKQIMASVFTLGLYLGYQAAKSYWKTGQVTLFTTERQNKLNALIMVSSIELEHIKPSSLPA